MHRRTRRRLMVVEEWNKRMSKGRIIGLICVLAAVLVVGGAMLFRQAQPEPEPAPAPVEPIEMTGYLGGEKISLFDDPEFVSLAEQAALSIGYRKAGSLAMMEAPIEGMDYLFPSSQAAVAYGHERGIEPVSEQIVLNSPIVIYTYRDVADALVGSGIMAKDGEVYTLNVDAAVEAMLADRTWADLGYTAGYGQFRIDSTDPAESNSGNEWAALVANSLAGGQPASVESIDANAGSIRKIFAKSGWMETSSEDSFRQFLTLGEGSKPMMVGYESQVLDLSVNEPDLLAQVADNLVVAYTTPTVWSTHVIMALDEAGEQLTEFLMSDEVQKLAWERHGFRGASQLGTDSAERFGVAGIAERVPAAVELPAPAAMGRLIEVVSGS